MEVHECDSVMQNLSDILETFDKKLKTGAVRQWRSFFMGVAANDAERALDEFIREEARYPKIYDIQERIKNYQIFRGERKQVCASGDFYTQRALQIEEESEGIATDRMFTAWEIMSELQFGQGMPWYAKRKRKRIEMTRDEAIEICNKHASHLNMPDAIYPQFKIPEYWD